jgi:threonine-phosphate decarboxylase
MIHGHGGDVNALAKRLGCFVDAITDMSSNLNPLGPPEGLEDFIAENVAKIRSLPQADAQAMVTAFGNCCGIDSARVMAANGTTWLIYTLPAALRSEKVLIAGPTYSDYKDGCIMQKVRCDYAMAVPEHQFQPDLTKLSDLISNRSLGYDTVIVCNPNNPTGTLIQKSAIIDLVCRHPSVRFVIDESYLPFVQGAEAITLTGETALPNLIVLSSMSKIFTIPGLRTGFVCADPDIINAFMAYYPPWSVNALAQAAVVHLFENASAIEPFVEKTRSFVRKERTFFENMLMDLSGIRLYRSSTYFILAEITANLTSADLCHIIGNERLLIRDCANFEGLSDRFVRFSLKTRKANLKLATLLKAVSEGFGNFVKV